MTPEQKSLVQNTFEKVAPRAEEVGTLFYNRLFELDPSVKPLFTGDIHEQGRKLIQMPAVAVRGLDRLEEIVSAVQELGRRHVNYGVQEQHYNTVGAALLWTLEQGLQEEFMTEAKEAWTTVYGVLAQTMKDAAAS